MRKTVTVQYSENQLNLLYAPYFSIAVLAHRNQSLLVQPNETSNLTLWMCV